MKIASGPGFVTAHPAALAVRHNRGQLVLTEPAWPLTAPGPEPPNLSKFVISYTVTAIQMCVLSRLHYGDRQESRSVCLSGTAGQKIRDRQMGYKRWSSGRILTSAAMSVIAVCALPSLATAQTADVGGDVADPTDIIVTAQKRAQSLSDGCCQSNANSSPDDALILTLPKA